MHSGSNNNAGKHHANNGQHDSNAFNAFAARPYIWIATVVAVTNAQ